MEYKTYGDRAVKLEKWPISNFGTECDDYIRIFKYSNILVTNIYSDIRSYQFFFYEYIRTFVRVKFVCTNIFGHSLVSVLECKTQTNIRIYSNIHAIFNTNTYSDIRSCQKNQYEYIRIFIRVILLIRIYSDIHSYQNFHECHTLFRYVNQSISHDHQCKRCQRI